MAEKQKLQFFVAGKRFAYEGFPENRRRDLLDFIVKRKISEEQWVAVFRENQSAEDASLSDSDIVGYVKAAQEAREKKKAAKAAASADPAPQPPAETPAPAPEQKSEYAPPPAAQQPAEAPPAEDVRPSTKEVAQPAASGDAGSGRTGMRFSDGERAQLRGFIDQILTEEDSGVAAASPAAAAAPAASPSTAAPRAAGSSGKITVYLETRQDEANKIVNVAPGTSFADFEQAVQKKFGKPMEMVFSVDDDRISLDDDDSLEMFLSLPVRKFKLFCTPLGTQQAEKQDDTLTSTVSGVQTGKQLEAALSQAQASQEFHREERTFTGHAAAVYCVAFSPQGDRFATASRDRTVRVWNIESGECKLMSGGHNGFVLSCDFSPNGEYIVSSSDDMSLKIWNARTGEKKHTLKGHSDKVYCAKFNSTGAYVVSGSCDRTVRVWNADNGSRQATLKGHTMAVFSCGFSKTDNGKHVVSASDDRMVKIWEWRDNRELATLEGHTGTVWSCEYSHNDRLIVSASMDHEIKLWDVAARAVIRNYPGHMTPIHHAIFTADDRYILSCARDWTVMVWDTETGRHVDTLSGHVNTVYHMDLQNDRLLTCSLDETVKLWRVALPQSSKASA